MPQAPTPHPPTPASPPHTHPSTHLRIMLIMSSAAVATMPGRYCRESARKEGREEV